MALVCNSSAHPKIKRLLVPSGADVISEGVCNEFEVGVFFIREEFWRQNEELDVMSVTSRNVCVCHMDQNPDPLSTKTIKYL